MPELPEVETIRRQLNRVLIGQTIKDIDVRHKKSFHGSANQIIGQKIVATDRKAKVLIIKLATGLNLLIHLKMTGQLVYVSQKKGRVVGGHPTADWVNDLPSKHTRVTFHLSQGTLFFNDMRIFGWIKIVNQKGLAKELNKFGPDINDSKLTPAMFYHLLQRSGRSIKLVVMDQSKVAGVGNIYANEALWCASINPQRPAKDIKRKESDLLLNCLRKVITAGIKYGGATASDESFVNLQGLGGQYQEHFLVYEQAGKKCHHRGCSGQIKKTKLGGRGTYFCPQCQT